MSEQASDPPMIMKANVEELEAPLLSEEVQTKAAPPTLKRRRVAVAVGALSTCILLVTVALLVAGTAGYLYVSHTSQQIGSNGGQDIKDGWLVETTTKKKFKLLNDQFSPKGQVYMAMGAGVRTKKELGVEIAVYAIAFYVEPKLAREGLVKWKGKSVDELESDKEFHEELIHTTKFDRTTHMIIASNLVTTKKMMDAIAENLTPRVQYYLQDGENADEIVQTFLRAYNDQKIHDNSELIVTCLKNGDLHIVSGGKEFDVIPKQQTLCKAWHAMYVDDNAIGKTTKRNFGSRLAALWDGKVVDNFPADDHARTEFPTSLESKDEALGAGHYFKFGVFSHSTSFAGAMYISPDAFKESGALADFKKEDSQQLANNQEYFAALTMAPHHRSMMLKFSPCRGGALSRCKASFGLVASETEKIYKSMSTGGVEMIDGFKSALNSITMENKDEYLLIECTPDQQIVISFNNGKAVQTLFQSNDNKICTATFSSFLGQKTPFPKMKRTFAERVPEIASQLK